MIDGHKKNPESSPNSGADKETKENKKADSGIEKEKENQRELDNFIKDSPPTTAASANQATDNQPES